MAGDKNTCLKLHLVSHRLWERGGAWRKLANVVRWGNQLLLGCYLGSGADIDPTCTFPHNGMGVVIHGDAVVGPRCTIFQRVTLGVSYSGGGASDAAPRIGANVLIGAGACVLGGVTVGDGARIGANAVVLKDVPAGATAVGVPARIIMPKASEDSIAADGKAAR